MSDITMSTTVADLVTAGLISSTQELERLLKRKSKKPSGQTDAEVQEFADRIFALVEKRGSETIKWKTGNLVGQLEGLFSGSGCEETERERRRVHGQVSKALKLLTSQGVLEKPQVTNATRSHYLWTGKTSERTEPETNESLMIPVQGSAEAEIQDAVIIEEEAVVEAPKPKARVRKRKNKK